MALSNKEEATDVNNADDKEEESKAEVGVNPQDVLDDIVKRGTAAIQEMRDQILKYPPSVDAFLETANTPKNRFPNVLLYDSSRVKIKDKLGSDYYHASFVDSFDKADGYILAQAPFDEATETDFWRMAYQQRPTLIVLLTALVSAGGKRLCKNFWPSLAKQEREYAQGSLRVRCQAMDQDRQFDTFDITITSAARTKQSVRTQLLQFHKWVEDREIPDNLLEFRALLKIAMARAEKEERNEGPIIFICPSGVHRCGTVAALDIVMDRLTIEKKVGLLDTINVVRRQRYGCFTHFDHYSHVADLIVRHAVSSGLADPNCIGVRKR
ncbi:hypothetical protein M3Y96_00090900 [Aphelenchoides besseyi]|nr:hypothetical protein M3Y96_00090900 [Aphelenchoides besseyi]